MQPDEPISFWIWILVVLAILLMALAIWWTLRKARKVAVVKAVPAPDGAPPFRNLRIPSSFSQAIGFLKGRTVGRNYRYELPWILMLGGYRSGARTVLANAGPLEFRGDPSFGIGHGPEWWFYRRGLVLRPPSDMVLRSDARTSDDRGFELLLTWLLRKRPRRPLDGIVLTISAEELLDPSGRSKLIMKASVIRQKLSLILRQTSMRLPVYVLVTKCDQVPGFSSFAAELPAAHTGMFGWSNPYPFDSAFSPDWVTQGFEEMDACIAERRMDVFAERSPVRDPDGVFLFPNAFQRLADPLRTFLTQALQDNAYEESFFFRGFYFCGDPALAPMDAVVGDPPDEVDEEDAEDAEAPESRSRALSIVSGTPARVVDEKTPVFLHDLFAAKIFPESHLAKPLRRIDMSRNRTVRTAAILTAAFVLVAGIGTLVASVRLRWLGQNDIAPLLKDLIVDMETASHHKARVAEADANRLVRVKSVNAAAGRVLGKMALLSTRRFGSVFIPASYLPLEQGLNWNKNFDNDLKQGMSEAFQEIVLEAFRAELEKRLATIVEAGTPLDRAEDGPELDEPEKVPQYPAWVKYADDLKQLETNGDRYNRISTAGAANLDDFRGLVDYLRFSTHLPPGFDFDNPYFKEILTKSQSTPFRYSENRQEQAKDRAAKLIDGFFRSWYGPKNRIALEIDSVAAGVDGLGGRLDYSELSALATGIGSAADDLQSSEFEWVSREEVPKELISVFTQPIAAVTLLQEVNTRDVEAPATQAFLAFRNGLKAKKARLTGPILNMNADPVELSSSVATLRENLSYLLSQTFAARSPGPPMQTTPARYLWDRASLLEAQKLFEGYDRFERGSLRSMPSYMSSVLRRVAQERLEANVLDLVGQAQLSVSPAPHTQIDEQELKDFTQSVDLFESLLTGFGKFANHTWSQKFSALLQDQAKGMLAALDAEIAEDNPYAVKNAGFDWWEGQRPFAPAAYEVRTADDLKEHLDETRDQLSAIADKADPLLKFIEPRLSAGTGTPPSVIHLRSMVAELKRYREKRPGNSVTLLEDFIQTGLDKIAPDGACQDPVRDPVGRSDLFLLKRATLRSKVLERCRVLSRMAYTNQIEKTFNDKLAGRFPFAAPSSDREADPAALKDFLDKYDQFGKVATESLKNAAGGPRHDAVSAFLTQVAQIRPVFSAFLAGYEKDPAPSFDIVVAFRVNLMNAIDIKQVADWGLVVGQQNFSYRGKDSTGAWRSRDPIRFTLRFADDSPVLPVADDRRLPYQVTNKRTVSFEYDGPWSLFRLLLAHKANRGELDLVSQKPHLLSFYIPTVPDPRLPQPKDGAPSGLVKVYMQLTVIPPGAKEGTLVPLPFPDSAPQAGDITEHQ